MSNWLTGLAFRRCFEHPQAEEIDSKARLTLVAMASFVREEADPFCLAAKETIASRGDLSVSTVARAQKTLAGLGLIEHRGMVPGRRFVIRWAMPVLGKDWPSSVTLTEEGSDPSSVRVTRGGSPSSVTLTEEGSVTPNGRSVTLTEEGSVTLTEEGSVTLTEDSSDSSGRLRKEEEGSDGADAPASAGAPAVAAPSSAMVGGIVGEAMAAFGYTQDGAQQWMARKLAGATGPVRSEVAFLRACIARDLKAAAFATESEAPAVGGTGRPPTAAAASARHLEAVPDALAAKAAKAAPGNLAAPAEEVAERARLEAKLAELPELTDEQSEATWDLLELKDELEGDPTADPFDAIAEKLGVPVADLERWLEVQVARDAIADSIAELDDRARERAEQQRTEALAADMPTDAWLALADYDVLRRQGATVSDAIKQAAAEHGVSVPTFFDWGAARDLIRKREREAKLADLAEA